MIFIGSVYPDSLYNQILREETHIDFAAHTFQLSLLEGLCAEYKDISILTSPVTSSYPHSKHLTYSVMKETISTKWPQHNRILIKKIFVINIPFVKLISEYFQIKSNLKSELKTNETVFIYALHSPFLLAAYVLRKKIKKICVIVPDLPEYMSHNNGLFRKILKKINQLIINKCLRAFNNYVLFSRMMESKLPIKGKKYIVVEGIFAPTAIDNILTKETKKTILYSGIINKKYGVFDLLEAFHKIDGDDYQLLLCGSCSIERDILDEYISTDHRIKYLGLLPKNEVRALQRSATIVVNPRHSNDEYTKYSFPSKTMEYMASGTPTLMCRLPAIPKEYNRHLFFFDDESIEGYRNRIEELCNMDSNYLFEFGQQAKQFILENKNCYSQAKRIYDMIET